MRHWGILLAAFVWWLTPAAAAEEPAALTIAKTAFHNGYFLEAATLARRAESAEGFAYAARAVLVHADFLAPPEMRLALFRQAEEDARLAIALSPDFAEGHLQLAVALGFRGRFEGRMTAHFEGYADEARAHLDYVAAREPDNPWMHALLGGWHLEIAEVGGLLGRALYGAAVDTGIAEYERALELQPGDLVITAQYALQLSAMSESGYRGRAAALLAPVVEPESPSALNLLTLARIRQLREALDGGDAVEIARVVREQKGEAPTEPAAPARPRHSVRPPIGSPR